MKLDLCSCSPPTSFLYPYAAFFLFQVSHCRPKGERYCLWIDPWHKWKTVSSSLPCHSAGYCIWYTSHRGALQCTWAQGKNNTLHSSYTSFAILATRDTLLLLRYTWSWILYEDYRTFRYSHTWSYPDLCPLPFGRFPHVIHGNAPNLLFYIYPHSETSELL